ncbi:hypothetical protein A3D09_02910 [Candidatus Collierbacteria bacterium RIFCSPHIGHO2_02_FULL_49_10]|uniref:Uncharacterized protein n=1 Tax=Candidatus Collierbacteria bacterium RIFCSPHIGHO2_02_FULL_49_10 TaxID=1817723 RepID=A0A1F5EYL8_9BACT|nr:MAG: hypothetical protein A3D09_02910 [Candidatus Collierbacteria bacterium RIFCSPHIGHO2_02_FULL_49_10]
MKKISNIKYQISNREAGVTLLLSILILAGLTLITLSIGSFAIQELRASRAVIVTEPAIAAAESAGEQGLWSIKRSNTLAQCPIGGVSAVAGTGLSNNTFVQTCKSYDKALIRIEGGTLLTFYLYDPNNINGDIDLQGFPITSISFAYISGTSPVSISVLRLNNATTGISPSTAVIDQSVTSSQTITTNLVAMGTEGRMKVTLTSSTDTTVEVNTNLGMPTYPTVDAYACSSRAAVSNCNSTSQEIFSRRINVTVPQ